MISATTGTSARRSLGSSSFTNRPILSCHPFLIPNAVKLVPPRDACTGYSLSLSTAPSCGGARLTFALARARAHAPLSSSSRRSFLVHGGNICGSCEAVDRRREGRAREAGARSEFLPRFSLARQLRVPLSAFFCLPRSLFVAASSGSRSYETRTTASSRRSLSAVRRMLSLSVSPPTPALIAPFFCMLTRSPFSSLHVFFSSRSSNSLPGFDQLHPVALVPTSCIPSSALARSTFASQLSSGRIY